MVTLACAGFLCGSLQAATAYFQMNLASAISELAAHQNPWGMSFGPTSPFWVSNQGSNDSTLYNAAGVPQPGGSPLIVTTPASPRGQVFNFTPSFRLPQASHWIQTSYWISRWHQPSPRCR